MSGPNCLVCGATTNTQFNMFPKIPNFKFGEICVPCEQRALFEKENENA